MECQADLPEVLLADAILCDGLCSAADDLLYYQHEQEAGVSQHAVPECRPERAQRAQQRPRRKLQPLLQLRA